jgi:uncharacterized membrane protein YeaQ/YmgE (transglycosylase-associated protein family)
MWLVWAALLGLLIGALARLLTPGRTPSGIIVTIAIGIIGSVAATGIGRALDYYSDNQSAGFFASLIGAIAFILILQALGGRRTG